MPRQRRGRGDGTVYQRPDGYWVGQINLGWQVGADGKRTRKRLIAARRFLVAWSVAVSMGAGALMWHIDGPKVGIVGALVLGLLSVGMCIWAERP